MISDGMQRVPNHARVVIVGGGIMGCGLAYHLAHEGWSDIVLLEKAELTSGSTWHAAGPDHPLDLELRARQMRRLQCRLYSGALEAETGQSVTWHGCGSFRLAYTDDEMDWLRHTLSVGTALGFNIELVDRRRVREFHPFYNLDGVLAALHTPDDGHVDPSGVTQALAARALANSARKSSAAAAPPTSSSSPNGEWIVTPNTARSPANTSSMPAAPMPARWASGPACSCR